MTDFIAKGYQVVTPYLTVNNAAEAIRFYVKAFGAKEVMRFEEDGVFVHGEIQIAGRVVYRTSEHGMRV